MRNYTYVFLIVLVLLAGCETAPKEWLGFKPEPVDLGILALPCADKIKAPSVADIASEKAFLEWYQREVLTPYETCADSHNESMRVLRDKGYIR